MGKIWGRLEKVDDVQGNNHKKSSRLTGPLSGPEG